VTTVSGAVGSVCLGSRRSERGLVGAARCAGARSQQGPPAP
jgi:hypothetical protein